MCKRLPSVSVAFLVMVTSFAVEALGGSLTIREAMNAAGMLEAASSCIRSLPLADGAVPGYEDTLPGAITTWVDGVGDFAATYLDGDQNGYVMTGSFANGTGGGLGTFQASGVRGGPLIPWSGSFDESGWACSTTAVLGGRDLNINYAGTLTGTLGQNILMSFAATGHWGPEAITVQGNATWFFDPVLDAYASMEHEQLTQVGNLPIWAWVVGGEALFGGIVGGVAAEDGWKNKVGGVFYGACTGVMATAAVVYIRAALAAEQLPPNPPGIPLPPGIPPVVPLPPATVVPLPGPLEMAACGMGLSAIVAFMRRRRRGM